MAGLGQRVAQAADDQAADQRGVAEAHLGLGRMDVDVDRFGRHVEEQRHDRMAVAGEEIGIGAAHGAGEQLSRTGRPLTNRYWYCAVAR